MSDTPDMSNPDGDLPDDAPQDSGQQAVDPQSVDKAQPVVDTIDSLRDQLAQAEQQALLAQAELENYRKRTQRLADAERKYAAMPFLRELLPIVDNLSRAVSAANSEEAGEGIVQGVEMVGSQIETLLNQHQCAKIDPLGEAFDPQLHEAVGQQHHAEVPQGCISLVMQTGYQMHDRVVRPAQVFVSAGPPPAGDAASEDPTPLAEEN
jgi:molecular chaperone GrpE